MEAEHKEGNHKGSEYILVGKAAAMVQSITVQLLLFTAIALHGERDPGHGCILVLNGIDSKRGGKDVNKHQSSRTVSCS